MYWKAKFEKPCNVFRVKTKSIEEYPDRIEETKVYIGNKMLGKHPGTIRSN